MGYKVHVPDAVFVIGALLVQVMTYGLLVFMYPELPDHIPTHYNLAGQPDAFNIKSLWTVFDSAFLQTGLTAGLLFLFRRPQYAHIPGTLFLPLLPSNVRRTLEHVIRHMIVMLMLLLNLIFANIALTSVMVAFHLSSGLNMWIMGLLVFLLIMLPIEYLVLMTKLVKQAVAILSPAQRLPTSTEAKEHF